MLRLVRETAARAVLILVVAGTVVGCGTDGSPTQSEQDANVKRPATVTSQETPPAAPENVSTLAGNLIPSIDLEEHLLQGKAESADAAVVTQSLQSPELVAVPADLPEIYEVHCRLTRSQGDGPAFLGLVLGGQPCLLVVDGWPELGSITGVSLIDGKAVDQPDYPARPRRGRLIATTSPPSCFAALRQTP